ncbi:amphi-Trp domain-containing protein [Salidesulfovibrio brasiliensis]|uniref:amphi-Trp domain-containing protein n=1 Tax=Salidesulfovibrio brasiliensis TaxID=221711 RepID=UPI0006CFD500|nr:amphi-Trp domain-containing protein [Salidesulfovibrio brasiliensis]
MSEEKFLFDSLQDCESIGDFLGSLTEGFRKGDIALATNGDEIVLRPEGLLNFTVKAKKKGNENKLSIKINWKQTTGPKEGEPGALKVR